MKLKDNKIYRSIIIPICIAMCMLGRFIPPINGLTSDAMGVIFIFLGSLSLPVLAVMATYIRLLL